MKNSRNLDASQPHKNLQRTAGPRRMPSISSRPNNDDGDISLGFVFGVWKQWWKRLIPISLLLATTSCAVVWLTFQPKYRATARLEIAEESPWVIFQDDGGKAKRFVQTQIEMLRSPRVLNEVLSDETVAAMPELRSKRDPVKWLIEKGLEIEPVGESVFVSVAYKGPDPKTAAHFVNTLIDKYFQVQESQKNLRTAKILDILNATRNSQEAQVDRLQSRVKELGSHLPDVTPNLTGSEVVVNQSNPLQDMLDEIMTAELERENLDASIKALEASLTEGGDLVVSEALVHAEIESLPEIQMRKQELNQAEALLTTIEATAKGGKNSARYLSQLERIEGLKNALAATRASSYKSMAQKVMATDRVQREQELKLRRTALAAKTELVSSLDRRYQAKRSELGEQGGARLEFVFAQQALQRALGLLTSISDRATQMQAEMVAPGRPAVYRTATPPVEPEVKYPLVGLAASALASLALPFAIAFVWETSVRRISTAEQLEQKTDVGVIGEISRLPMKKGRATSRVLGMELGLFEESIDSLRTGLLLSNDEHEIQVLAVCSAVSGEGKTSVSSQLAVSIARATGQPVLLIDGDMRAPDVHHIFDIPLSPGLADVLDHEVSLEEAINRSWSEHVHLLPAGELTKSPHKLLGNPAMRTTLDEARLWYRFIVIDTPPVLAASESLVVAKQADATLLCAMRDFSRENHVRLAHGKLVATGADMIGTVLNGVPVRSYASRYGSYGRYGYAGTSS